MKLHPFRLGSIFVSLVVAIPCAAQIAVPTRKTISPAPSAIPADADLPESVRAVLTRIRDQVAEQKLTFSVGYTGASEFPIEMITGLKPPANLSGLARQQSDSAPEAQAQVKQACSGSEASFDWRQHDGATPVRDQGPCGSCWAFGTHAAFEGSWRIPTHVGLDTSEQATLSCSGKGTCAGGWWAFDYLIASGAADEKDWPYSASDEPCRPAVPKKWKASVWSYVDPAGGNPAPARVKEALCRYGPVVVAVRATPAFQVYTGGVFNEHAPGSINHAITVIGWDEAKKAWLIKNSWGAVWGETGGFGSERGYMWIAYDSNQVGSAAAWVAPKVKP